MLLINQPATLASDGLGNDLYMPSTICDLTRRWVSDEAGQASLCQSLALAEAADAAGKFADRDYDIAFYGRELNKLVPNQVSCGRVETLLKLVEIFAEYFSLYFSLCFSVSTINRVVE